MAWIRCWHCKQYHPTVKEVRECAQRYYHAQQLYKSHPSTTTLKPNIYHDDDDDEYYDEYDDYYPDKHDYEPPSLAPYCESCVGLVACDCPINLAM